jgi:phthiocerol/phenolphthiocerol synthesis type-I polyketide synthase E
VKNSKPSKDFSGSEIAIIGMAGRFPGARDIDAFWNNLRNGLESITFFTDEQLRASGVSTEVLDNPNYVKARPVLEDVELFDAGFFGFSPREAQGMDPQHRLFLECVYEAIENAGYDAGSYKGAISVYAGASMSSYLINNLYTNPEALALVGEYESFLSNVQDSLATRIAYKLNLKGACFTVTTFCSTSLVAAHLACQSLLNFECDMAVAGGVTIFNPQNTGYWYQEGLIISPDGHCRPFDAKAQGTIFGNGLGAVVLKRLEDALTDGDHVEAVILGSATNNDGSLKVSYAAPSVAGQAEVIVEALANAAAEPETITYVEAHGTATALGDPAEVAALVRAFHSGTQRKGFCALGSVKSNVGHLDAAGGVAGLIKTVLALKHKEIPPSLHFERPNPNIDFENSPFYVIAKASEWKVDGIPRRAGVSSFGVGGTNAHVILQEAPVIKPSSASRPHQLLFFSAKTSSALEAATKNLAAYLNHNPHLSLADVAYTLQVGRKAFNHRRVIVCQDINDAVSTLEAADPRRMSTVYQEKRNPPVVFMFPGQGSQYVNMGLELYRTESIYREEVNRCSEILQSHFGLDLRDILYPEKGNTEELAQQLKQTSITQPALFTIEYGLAKLWMSWGVHPEALVGHSIGEYVAACLAGVFSLEDALFLVATRGRLMRELPSGLMLAVSLSGKEVKPFLNQRLFLSAINSPSFCVVSGEKEAIEDLKEELSKKSIDCRPLHTSHAFHSNAMDPILDPFTEQVKRVKRGIPQIPFVSNLTGTWITSEEAVNPSYWAEHLRHTVRFSDCLQELLKEPGRVFLEVGPGQTLSTFVRQHSAGSKGRAVLPSVRHPKEEKSDVAFILSTLGRLWLSGVQVDWSGFYKDESRHRLSLPTYPFERQRYWIEPIEQPRGFFASQAGLGKMENNFEHPAEVKLVSDYLTHQNPELKNDYVAPRNELERTIAETWQKLLGVKRISIHDNFFDLGGSSMIAARFLAHIEKIFGKKLPPTSLYEAQTIGQLSKLLSDTPSSCVHAADTYIPYTIIPADLLESKQDIISLWKRNFQNMPEERYPWIYEENPFGPATCFLAKDTKQDSIVGATASFPRRVVINGKYHMAGLGGDFVVNKEHRLLAPALLLQNATISKCNEGKFDFLYGFPNKESQPVGQMLGFKVFDVLSMTKPLRSYYYLKKHFIFPAGARMISGLVDLATKTFSKETRYQRHNGFTSEILSSFDGRFDQLWEKVLTRFAIIGERSSSYLNWRYVRSPHHNHYVFAITRETNPNILGYIVFHIVENRTNVDDILCLDMNETLDFLLSGFLLFQRKEGIDSISIAYAGTQLLVKKLQEFGFSIRDKENKISIYGPSDSPFLSCLLEKENWYLMPGDNDI